MCYAPGGPDWRSERSRDKPVLWTTLLLTAWPKHEKLQAALVFRVKRNQDITGCPAEIPLCFRELDLGRGVMHTRDGPPARTSSSQWHCSGSLPKRVFAASNAKTRTRPIGLKTYLNQNRCTSISEIQIGSNLCVSTSVDSCPFGFHTRYI